MAFLHEEVQINARLQLFAKATDFHILPPTRNALDLHSKRENHQVKLWLQAGQEGISLSTGVFSALEALDDHCAV